MSLWIAHMALHTCCMIAEYNVAVVESTPQAHYEALVQLIQSQITRPVNPNCGEYISTTSGLNRCCPTSCRTA